jgi:predicted nucleic acid-binding protein
VTRFVLDASYAISWAREEEQTPEALNHLRALGQREAEALVPMLWCTEIANVLLTLERSNKLSAELVSEWTTTFCMLPITVSPDDLVQALTEVRPLAQAHGLSVYDASYLHLAMREQVPLATFDRQLIKAAPKVGVRLVD